MKIETTSDSVDKQSLIKYLHKQIDSARSNSRCDAVLAYNWLLKDLGEQQVEIVWND